MLEVSELNKLRLEWGNAGNKLFHHTRMKFGMMFKSTCLINSQLKHGGRILSGTPVIRMYQHLIKIIFLAECTQSIRETFTKESGQTRVLYKFQH